VASLRRPGARGGGLPERLSAPPPFVGRQRELELLQRCIADVLAARPRLVLVEGEAGVGKSRLLKEIRERAQRDEVQVLCGRCSEDLPLPYRPFVEALEEPLRDVCGTDADSPASLLSGRSDEPGDQGRAASGPEQLRLFRAVSRGCLALARRRPTMLVLEDLHWADRSTLDLLEHVVFAIADAASRAPASLVVLCTYRGTEIGERLARTIARLRREEVTITLDLQGLDEPEIDLLIRGLGLAEPTHQLVTSVRTTTRGNPLFVQELLHDLVKRGALRRRGGFLAAVGDLETARLPAELTGVIAARMQPLGERCRDVLRLASLVGLRFSLQTLAAVSGSSEDTLLALLEEAMQQRLLVSDGPVFEFAHPLVRHVLASEQSGFRVQTMHRRIAETLQHLAPAGSDDALLEITHHLIAAGPVADARTVLDHARRAGQRAIAMSAWGEAACYFEAAIAVAGDCSAHEQAVLHHRAAFAYSRDQDAGPCLEQYALAIARYRETPDVRALARAIAEQTRAHVMLAAAPYGALVNVDPLREVLTALGDHDAELRGECLATLAVAHWTARQPVQAERAAREALAVGADNHRIAAEAYHALALSQLHTLRQQDALESWEHSRDHARQAGDRWLESAALQRIPLALVGLGRLADAESAALAACEIGRETENWAGCSLGLGNLVLVAVARGDFLAAEDHAREALTMVRRARYGWAAPYFMPALACARVLRGACDEAADALTILVTPGYVFDDPGPSMRLLEWVYQQLVRAHADRVENDVRDRLYRLAAAGAAPEIVNLAGISALVEAGDLIDDAPTAEAPYDALLAAAERGVVLTLGWTFLLERVLGVAATRARQWPRAETHFDAAAAAASRMGARPELARTHLDHARMLLARGGIGDGDRAVRLLANAAAGFESLGMPAMLERTARVAERIGATLPGASKRTSDPRTLAAPEIDVLRRISRGRNAHQIADELAMAPTSAEHRIRAVLGKIGVGGDVPPPAPPPGRMAPGARPSNPLAIMFTDIEGSTATIDRLGDVAAREMLRVHDAIVRAALAAHGGAEVSHTGDGLMATFHSATGAVVCAIAIQKAVAHHARAHPELPVRVRIGLNAGEPIVERELLFGAAVNAAARICARARGGQILVADVVRQLAAGTGVAFVDRRRATLKGFRSRFHLFEVTWDDG
jgi:eukaryotic-like serine/threonine-protein kinase